ncbi:MAG: hypothetical protein RL011_1043 [Pseudomonadota bacterium]
METLNEAIDERNRIKWHFALLNRFVSFAAALSLASVLMASWSLVKPTAEGEQVILGLVAGCLVLILRRSAFVWHETTVGELCLYLDMRYGDSSKGPLRASAANTDLPSEWQAILRRDHAEFRGEERRRLLITSSALVIPLVLAALLVPRAAPSLKVALRQVSQAVDSLQQSVTLSILQGAANEQSEKSWQLASGKTVSLELLATNLVELKVHAGGSETPVIELRRSGASGSDQGAVFQTFQMTPVRTAVSGAVNNLYMTSFAVSEDVQLFLPNLNRNTPLALLKVRQLPLPKVEIQVAGQLEDPWPDDQPLPLRIKVHSENPLQTVHLLIKNEQKVAKELVANVMTEDKFELITDYRILLEPYVENDIAEIDVVAEAVDRALPTPLTGRSEPLRLRVASAYGRYRQALGTLRELKGIVDGMAGKNLGTIPPEAVNLSKKAVDESERSPFFDGLDRLQMRKFATLAEDLVTELDADKLFELSQSLNDFLFEHEILDDRERDRDFFVAARALSHQLEMEVSRRPLPIATVISRTLNFLNGREERWRLRVARLGPNFEPPAWSRIHGQRPFHKAINQIQALDKKASATSQSEQLTQLSRTVTEYRSWLQELEALEDKMRDEDDKSRQQGLSSARDTLKELQKLQGEISAELDRASEREQDQLSDQWPGTRAKQNSNIKATKALEGQLKTLSPNAAMRIQAAGEAMEQVIEAGGAADYRSAEAGADLAGRLLRQADSAAQQSQQKRRNRGRRRRVTGDNYYGQSIVGGDLEIKREYQVDRKYREDILEEVQTSQYDDENRALLENYLRHVIR